MIREEMRSCSIIRKNPVQAAYPYRLPKHSNKAFTLKNTILHFVALQQIQAFNPTFIRNQYINIISKIKYRFKGYLKAYNQQFKIINHHII